MIGINHLHKKLLMNTSSCAYSSDFSFFTDAENQFKAMAEHLSSDSMATEEHGSIEQYIHEEGSELLRLMLQAALDRIAALLTMRSNYPMLSTPMETSFRT